MSPAMARRPEARWAQTSALRAVLRPSKKARATKRARAAARDAAADARGPPATGSGKAELIPNFSAARAIRDGNCHDTRGAEMGQGAAFRVRPLASAGNPYRIDPAFGTFFLRRL